MYRQKRRKESIGNTSNRKIYDRDMQNRAHANNNFGFPNHDQNVDRLLMERDGFNINTTDVRHKTRDYRVKRKKRRRRSVNFDDYDDYDDHDNFGEITGKISQSNSYDHGMPMRSSYSTKKAVYDQNSYLDFDLFNKDKKVRSRVKYSDPSGGDFCGIDDSTSIISERSDPHRICLDGISSINVFLHNNIRKVFKESYNINGLSLYITFAILFYGSARNSEIELKNYFNFLNKDVMSDEINRLIHDNVNSIYPFMKFRSYVLNDRFVPLSKQFAKLSTVVPFITIDTTHPVEESHRLNDIFRRETGAPNIISKKTVRNIEVAVINIMRLNPVWGIPVDSLEMHRFMGMKNPFIKFSGQSFGLYEDPDKIVFEIPMKGMKMFFGIVLPKSDNPVKISQSSLEAAISDMKETVIDEVLIPKIVKRLKMRLNTILQDTDLKVIFMDTDLPAIFPERGGNINDVVQYCDLIIDERSVKSKKRTRGYDSMRKIVVDRSFTYYVRYAPENLIMSMGHVH